VHNDSLITRRQLGGFTLIEILVTLLVASMGLLGIAGLHMVSLRNNYDALMRSHASALASDITDRMRANRAAVVDGGEYEVAIGVTPTGQDPSQARGDVIAWKRMLAAQLPTGDGSIAIDGATDIVRIVIQWGERGNTISFVTETEI
jgi:type IV pilus assembly protein PilV